MSEKGQIVVPKQARDQRGFGHGSPFAFFESKDGDLIFRPINVRPKQRLIEHLRKFKGVDIPDRSLHCPPRS
jgi:AbrB family looped-hinge helix DNA binding protein